MNYLIQGRKEFKFKGQMENLENYLWRKNKKSNIELADYLELINSYQFSIR
jgi:hypothetical protein